MVTRGRAPRLLRLNYRCASLQALIACPSIIMRATKCLEFLRLTTMSAAICVSLGVNSASADFASFSIPVQAVSKSGGTGGTSTIGLPDAGTPSFFVNFVLPSDYLTNGDARITLYLQSPVAPCTTRIRPVQLLRTRPSAALVNSLSGVSGGNPNTALVSGMIKARAMSFAAGNPPVDQKAGDGLIPRSNATPRMH